MEIEAQLAGMLGLDPEVAHLIDWSRGGAVGLLNPSLLAHGDVRPYIAMIPVKDRASIERLFEKRGAPLVRKPWGFVLPSQQGTVYIGFRRGYAVIAWREDLLGAAERVLSAHAVGKHDAPIMLHVDMENVYGAFRPQLDTVLEQISRLAEAGGRAGDPQVAYSLRGFQEVARSIDSVQALELLVNLDSGGLTFTARVDGKPNGEWASFVQQQKPGPAWGAQYLPADAVMAFTTHASPRGRAQDLRAALAYLADANPQHRPDAGQLDRWRTALDDASRVTDGALAYAVWPGRSGGVGAGGAYRVSDPAMGRQAIRRVYDELSGQLGPLLVRAMVIDPERFAATFRASSREVQLAGAAVDLVELTPRWPKGADAERRLFEGLFGPSLTLATAFIGDQAVFALGADWEPRLTAMIGTAHGTKAASLTDENTFTEALQFHPGARVSMTWLETGKMARFAAGLLAQVHELQPEQKAAIAQLLEQVGSGAIVTTTNVSGRRYEMTTHMPQSAIVGAARLNGALWRIALSPLFNPPMMPPMPVPPPHVAPSVRPPLQAEPRTL